jgi:DNA-binding transcriptional MerR regulator
VARSAAERSTPHQAPAQQATAQRSPSQQRTPARSGGEAPLLSIGQVLARLTSDFPDVTPSKLRFLEERQLIFPSRTESGYRKFSQADVDRLRFVLKMQRDHYLPLKVIRGYLDDLDAGRDPELPGGTTIAGPSILSTERRYKRDELVREAGATPQLLNDAVSSSLVAPADVYGDDSLIVLRSLVELQKSGIEPRHLRGFRAAAERELGLIESALIPVARRKDASSRAKAGELAREIAGQLEIVRSSLIRSALSRLEP